MLNKTERWFISLILCVCISLAGMIPASDFCAPNLAGDSTAPAPHGVQMSIGNGLAHVDAVITENLTNVCPVDTAVIAKRKGNGSSFHRTVIRHIIAGLIPVLILGIINLTIIYLNGVFGDVKQRMSIIIYIHDQDGQKGACLPF